LENVHWVDLKVNGKIKLAHREIACDVDKVMEGALKLYQFP
jgi:hypothetical protein